jgi:hypothetical protein
MGDMSKKDSGDKQLQFPHVELGSKPANEVWMQFEAKILAYLSSVYPDQVGWMLYDELDEKETFWGLKKVPEFKQWQDELAIRYHPGPKPLKKDYTNPPVPPAAIGEVRRSEYDQDVRFYTTRYDK